MCVSLSKWEGKESSNAESNRRKEAVENHEPPCSEVRYGRTGEYAE